MKAIVIREFGGPEVLRMEEVPRPVPGPGEVLVKVHAASVNRSLDILVRQNLGGYGVKLPYTPGVDAAGEIVEVGPEVKGRQPGDRVALAVGVLQGGAYAEYMTVAADKSYVIPPELSYAQGTVIVRHFPTAFGLARAADLKQDEWLLVMGAAGALGACSIQVAKQIGARVIAGAGADERVQAALDLGADHGVNYRTEDLEKRVMKITDGHGVDAVFENIADPTLWPGAFYSMAMRGRLVTVGAHGGGVVTLDVARLYHHRIHIMSGHDHTEPGDADHALKLAARGELRVLIDRILPLSQAPEGHRLAERNQVVGKVVLDPTLG